ncbi:YybH family protein [Maribacter hydrothermalis]|uniref:DUF4440 domain-containing protein n=1 Tax=Maribacter hydrothermalis TaxID=1836467 RepID=A0A1B7Z8S6_9FLAO|nr:nuclear transport factor 2 family protein [Maribacter hydrothermalis]APQ18849.1 DUF4440 domain-containing protein [Maribacter hydrothermalis]OBR39138.1 DUF4440 domain-containing protein [Maribacter hydrothermalis]
MKTILIVLCSLLSVSCTTKSNYETDKKEILNILDQQQIDWNNNDLEGFMQGYWKSDSLHFYSGAQLKSGWQTTLDSYRKGYPDKSYSGKLKFKIAKISAINNDAYYVMGEYHLTRKVGDANGTFMIVFKRIDGEWKIITDSSC